MSKLDVTSKPSVNRCRIASKLWKRERPASRDEGANINHGTSRIRDRGRSRNGSRNRSGGRSGGAVTVTGTGNTGSGAGAEQTITQSEVGDVSSITQSDAAGGAKGVSMAETETGGPQAWEHSLDLR